MSTTLFQKFLFVFALAGFLLSATFFCHFFSMNDHMETGGNPFQSASTISDKTTPCCYSQNSSQIFLDKFSAVQPISQTLLAKTLVTFVLLAGLAYGFNLFDSRERSRYRYYRDKNFLSRFNNYILQFLSQGILQPKVYNV